MLLLFCFIISFPAVCTDTNTNTSKNTNLKYKKGVGDYYLASLHPSPLFVQIPIQIRKKYKPKIQNKGGDCYFASLYHPPRFVQIPIQIRKKYKAKIRNKVGDCYFASLYPPPLLGHAIPLQIKIMRLLFFCHPHQISI